MKRFVSALVFCISLLVALSFFLFPPVEAKENILLTLLNLPAPPPPNPLGTTKTRIRDPKFYKKKDPPKDNAPLDELLDYWKQQNSLYVKLRYTPEMSEKTRERIMREIEKDPNLLPGYLNVLASDPKAADFVKEIYDREGTGGAFKREQRGEIKRWLTYNSPYFSSDLARMASHAADTEDYVTNQDEVLALARVDFDKARPIIDNLYNDSSHRASRVLAKWALYRHALDTDSTGDIERYREELKTAVADKSMAGPMRDLAMDALVAEKEWPGRDEWYLSLLADPTLSDLNSYTGLTTMIMISPEEKYTEKMLELLRSDNPTVRGAAIRNLITSLDSGNPEIIRAFLPWLEDPKWAVSASDTRSSLISALATVEMPESVPGLIKVLDEKANRGDTVRYATNANSMKSATNVPAAIKMSMTANSNSKPMNTTSANYAGGFDGNGVDQSSYPYRFAAISALAAQKDSRAVPALRRILPEVQDYERESIIKALIQCHGFSVAEEVDALESIAKNALNHPFMSNSMSNMVAPVNTSPRDYVITDDTYIPDNTNVPPHPFGPSDLKQLLGRQIIQSNEASDELAQAVAGRIEILDTKDPPLAKTLRSVILRWQGSAVDILLLRDLKNGKASADAIVRLLANRKQLSERLSSDVGDAKTGAPSASGIAACITGDADELASMLASESNETKTATLACARLTRAPLPVARVAEFVHSPDKLLALAAERYLESEDSPPARSVVLSLHPNEAKILGAHACFQPEGSSPYTPSKYLGFLFASVTENTAYNEYTPVCDYPTEVETFEKRVRKEVKADQELLGEYAFDGNFVKIYKDKTIFSWDDDDSRYHERALGADEFDRLKSYLTSSRVDEMTPFLECDGECTAGELLMLSRNGGRRVYYKSGEKPEFFMGLEKYFDDMKLTPAKLKYALSGDIPGLEILYADDDHQVETVWKKGDDLRIVVSDQAVRKKVDGEIADVEDAENEDINAPATDAENTVAAKIEKLKTKRALEGFAWFGLAKDGSASPSGQPPQIEYLPLHDGLAVSPTAEQWKARAGDVEFRADETGLYRVSRGKISKVQTGKYSDPVATPNGRWVVATKYDDESGGFLVRVNPATGKEFKVEFDQFPIAVPVAYVASINKVLVKGKYYGGHGDMDGEGEGEYTTDAVDEPMYLLDPETGSMQTAPGEFGPLAQQTFRPLQLATKPNEFWAALNDTSKKETIVGIFDTNHFGFHQVLKIPKIVFDSMAMWVDESASKVYFVYRGHLLSLPLNPVKTKSIQ